MTNDKLNILNKVDALLFKAGITIDEYAEYLGLSNNKRRLIKENEALEYLCISRSAFLNQIDLGSIKRVVVGPKTIRYDLEDLNDFISQHKSEIAV